MTSPDALERLTWLDRSKARSMRRHIGKLLDLIAEYARSLEIAGLVEDLEDDDLTFDEYLMIRRDPAMGAGSAGLTSPIGS